MISSAISRASFAWVSAEGGMGGGGSSRTGSPSASAGCSNSMDSNGRTGSPASSSGAPPGGEGVSGAVGGAQAPMYDPGPTGDEPGTSPWLYVGLGAAAVALITVAVVLFVVPGDSTQPGIPSHPL